ncbi:TPA: hypothetical protein I4E15_24070, partial [Enterobacter asburiae]|nr:hypothetical protein [Enterobacter asburiae]HAS1957780.1 hypothetical protein [Enterobacter asburiae]HAS1967551.1 hypothetical protein [Enterobacter asburiae]
KKKLPAGERQTKRHRLLLGFRHLSYRQRARMHYPRWIVRTIQFLLGICLLWQVIIFILK